MQMRLLVGLVAVLATACGGESDGDAGSAGGAGGAGGAAGGAGGVAGSGQAGSSTAGSGQAGSGVAGSGQAGSGEAGSGQAGSGQAGSGTAGSGQAGSGPKPDLSLGCKAPPPDGATLASPPKPYSGGTCPKLPQETTPEVVIQSSGNDRKFYLVVPANLQPDEKLPVLFLWHWLGGAAKKFYEQGEVQAAADQQRFLAVIPEKKGDLQFVWPYSALDNAKRMEEEATFFDDMLTCVLEQFNADANCVSSTGVSAGALWTGQLTGLRSEYLSSFISLSGGTGGQAIKPYKEPAHKLPGLVLWGGPTDNCFGLLNFEAISGDLEGNLEKNGQFFVECIHNCGHSVPPFESADGSKFKAMWQFALDHPFWLAPGESPYSGGLPADMPAWCGVGKGGATPRTGECTDSSGC